MFWSKFKLLMKKMLEALKKYRVKNIPAAGMGGKDLMEYNQLKL